MRKVSVVAAAFVIATAPLAGAVLEIPSTTFAFGLNGIGQTPVANDGFGTAFATGDFDCNGFGDLAIGIPARSGNAGAVQILYGGPSGLSGPGLYLTQTMLNRQIDATHTDPGSETNDKFGSALAAGNFNGDVGLVSGLECDDLAISAPWESFSVASGSPSEAFRSGAVSIVYGSELGLVPANSVFLTQYGNAIGDPAGNDYMGTALAAGNFNGGIYDDLAVGMPGKTTYRSPGNASSLAGAVSVFYGSSAGITTSSANIVFAEGQPASTSSAYSILNVDPNVQTVPENLAEANENLGKSLAVGRFNGDTLDDLAIGAPQETFNVNNVNTLAGAVWVLFGTNGTGLQAQGHFWWEAKFGQVPQNNDNFGQSIAFGRFDSDAYDDLAIGAPGEPSGSNSFAGAVFVISGKLTTNTILNQTPITIRQGTFEFDDAPETLDYFGISLAAGRFPTGGTDSDFLAVGAYGQKVNAQSFAGAVNIKYPGASGVTSTGSTHYFLNQALANFSPAWAPTANDRLGSSLATGDFNGDGSPDLAIGVPGEAVGGQSGAGVVHVLYTAGLPPLDGVFADGFEIGTTDNWSDVIIEEIPPPMTTRPRRN